MSATAILSNDTDRVVELEPICRILILHEAFSAYGKAVEVCRRVMQQLAGELDFDIKCWSAVELADATCARQAAKAAGAADVILLALPTGGLPGEFESWLDQIAVTRSKAEGVLALLVENSDDEPAALEQTLLRTNDLAGRLGVDFVTLFPEAVVAPADSSPSRDWPALARSREIADSPALDHWGLNE